MKLLHELACNENMVFENLKALIDISDKEVLEVGGEFPKDIALAHGIRKWVSVDSKIVSNIYEERYVASKGEILNYSSEKESFDIVFSSNAFQYISNFKQTMAYLNKLLRKGGKLFAHFGPIWTSPDGSMFENLVLSNGQVINFWENNIFPKWFHLLYSEGELREIMNQYFSGEDVDRILEYLFRSTHINRLFFNDYIEIFKATGFDILLLKTSDFLDYDLTPRIKSEFSDQGAKARLIEMYGQDNYDCRDLLVLLGKRN